MQVLPTVVRSNYYNIKIAKDKNDMFSFEYEEGYDRNIPEHKAAFENMEKIKNYHEQILSTLSTNGNASLEFDRDSMTVKLKIVTSFEKISNFIAMEFLACGTLGKMTFLDLMRIISAPFTSSLLEKVDDNKNMYV